MKPGQIRAVEVFCSYSREDEILWKELEKQLFSLRRRGLISAWHHSAVQPGKEWEQEIKQHLCAAQIILLLISPDFMASDQCYGIEMMQAMERYEAGEARVIPIILRHVPWEDEPFSKLQVLPIEGKPVKSWLDMDEAFLDIAKHVQRIVKQLLREQFLLEAEDLDKSGRHAEAVLVCEQGLSLSTGSDIPASWFRRTANIFMNCQKYEEALATYQEAFRLDKSIADSYFYQNKGHALKSLMRYEEARIAYQEAIRLSMPDPDPGLCYSLAIVFDQLAQQAREMAAQIRQGGSYGTSSS